MKQWPVVITFGLSLALGCGSTTPQPGPPNQITWEEYEKLQPEEQADPYILNNLDETARKKLDEKMKKERKR